MSFAHTRWLKNLKATLTGTRRAQPIVTARRSRPTRLSLESLEDRAQPAALTTLVTFQGANGSDPVTGLVRDSSGNLYGTSVAEIQAAHDEAKIAMTDIEVQGVAEYKALDPAVMAVFLLPPDFTTWQARLQRRYGDVVDVVDSRRRLQTALAELDQLLSTDYYVAVINDDLETAFQQIETITQSRDHTTPDEPTARAVAQKLSQDIRAHLDQST